MTLSKSDISCRDFLSLKPIVNLPIRLGIRRFNHLIGVGFLSLMLISGLSYCDEIDDLIPHIIRVESGGNPNAVGSSGEIGLMQISPIVLKEFKQNAGSTYEAFYDDYDYRPNFWKKLFPYKYPRVLNFYSNYSWGICGEIYPEKIELEDLKDPMLNKQIGYWYLRRLKDHYIPKDKYSVELLLACYNAGPTRMRKNNWDWKKAPKSTLRYIKKVLKGVKK